MTARRVVTLVCDKPNCRESYVRGDGQAVAQVRAEAKKLAGWRRDPISWADLCRWHS